MASYSNSINSNTTPGRIDTNTITNTTTTTTTSSSSIPYIFEEDELIVEALGLGIALLEGGNTRSVILYSTMLYSTVLYCTLLYCTMVYYTILYTILYTMP